MSDIQRGDYVRYDHLIYEVYGVHPDNGVRIGMTYVSAHLLEKVTPGEVEKYRGQRRPIIGCGCYGVPVNNHQQFYHCPLHGAAPDLLEALQMVQKRLDDSDGGIVAFTGEEWDQIDKAVTKATAQKGE